MDDKLPQVLLDNFARHITLSDDELNYLPTLFRTAQIAKKDFLLRAGEICRYETFVIQGCLRSYYIDDKGDEHTTLFAVEGWWTADLYSFITQHPSRYFIEAAENTSVLQISKTDLEDLYISVPQFERFFRLLLQNAYAAQEQRIVQNLSSTAAERYHAFKQKYPMLMQRVAQKHIASYLGITPVFLSMLRRKEADK